MLQKRKEGIAAEAVVLSATYVRTDLCAAWQYVVAGAHTAPTLSTEGLTQVIGCRHLRPGFEWGQSLQSVQFDDDFDESLCGTHWPETLQIVIFGDSFNQCIRAVRWPPALHTLRVRRELQSLS